MNALVDMLKGGDRRSLGESAEAVAAVSKTPALFSALFECLFDDDPVVRMRAADAVKKSHVNARTCFNPGSTRCWKRSAPGKTKKCAGTSPSCSPG